MMGNVSWTHAVSSGTRGRPPVAPPTTFHSTVVSIADIDAGSRPLRHSPPPRVRELADSIARHGLLHPVLVHRRSAEPGVSLVSGHRRLAAVRRLGWTEIPAYVMEGSSATDRLSVSIIENIQRQNLTGMERRAAYIELRQLVNGGTKAAAQLLGIHPASFRRALREAGEDGVRRLSIGQSVRAMEHWTAAADTLAEAKRSLLLQKANELVTALSAREQHASASDCRAERAVRDSISTEMEHTV